MTNNKNKRIIFFDGQCNLCNGSVQVVLRNDKKKVFHFAPLQSQDAQQFLQQHNYISPEMDSIVFYDRGKVYARSTAALKIAWYMDKGYPLLTILFIFPPFIRDWVYNWIGKNRYRWFGKRERCMVPEEQDKERFIFSVEEQ